MARRGKSYAEAQADLHEALDDGAHEHPNPPPPADCDEPDNCTCPFDATRCEREDAA